MDTNKHLATVAMVISLAACGGGGGDGDESGPPRFVTWKDSSNGIVVKDAADEGFGVETLSRSVVHIAKNNTLGGLTVDGNAQVIAKGAPIGLVLLGTATNGSQIAIFKCSDGTAMRLTISADGSNWSHSCSTGPTTPTTPTTPNPPTTPPATGTNASSCLSLGRDQWNGLQFTNTCNQRVYFTYCYNGGDSNLFRCKASSGGHYGQGAGSVSPGGTARLPDSASASGAVWFGCASTGNSSAQPIPRLTSLNPPQGECR